MIQWILTVFIITSLISHVGIAGKSPQITLSFDDAPRSSRLFSAGEKTRLIIKGLKDSGVTEAAFYCNPGQNPAQNWRLTDYSNAGHIITNHTADHSSLRNSSAGDFIKSIERADVMLSRIASYKRWFRYPMFREGRYDLSRHDAVKKYLKDNNYKLGYATIEIYDWYIESKLWDALKKGNTVDYDRLKKLYVKVIRESALFYENLAKEALGYSPVHVMLLHENDLNALYITDIVKMLERQGFQIVPASKAFEDPIADSKWDSNPLTMRRLRIIAESKGYKETEVIPEWANTDNLDELIKRSNVFMKSNESPIIK